MIICRKKNEGRKERRKGRRRKYCFSYLKPYGNTNSEQITDLNVKPIAAELQEVTKEKKFSTLC
jgi:hypothetical protein